MNKVIVLLSTFNGERYLRKQIESVLYQENVDVCLLVRDDGSTDSTRTILQKYEEQGALSLILGKNIGWRRSFMELVYAAPIADYYAFCDQDDIWLPNKLYEAIKTLEKIDDNIKLYCSNLYYYKDGRNFGLIRKYIPNHNIYTCLIKNIATGCTIVFNKNLKKFMQYNIPQYIIAHDFWIYQVAQIFGTVYYDSNSYIYYRQHSDNQIGAKKGILEIWNRRIKSLFKTDGRSLQAKELLNCYFSFMNHNTIDIVKHVAEYKKSPILRIKLFLNNNFTMGSFANNFWLRLRILLGKL